MAKLIMVGTCPNCGAQVVSRYPFEIGECKCENPHVQVTLEPALLLPPRYRRKLEQASKHSGIPMERLLDALLKEASAQLLRGLTVERKE